MILLERYWLSRALSSPFCCCSSATSSMVLLRADTSALYFCSAFSSAFHTRNVLSLMMLAWVSVKVGVRVRARVGARVRARARVRR